MLSAECFSPQLLLQIRRDLLPVKPPIRNEYLIIYARVQ
jgi:hypothetical protein